MLDKNYRKAYNDIFNKVLAEKSKDFFYESAILSYTHRNKLASTLFWNRVKTALSMPKYLAGSNVLDFGCGSGITFAFLKEQGCSIVGCDIEFKELADHVSKVLDIDSTVYEDLFKIEGEFDHIFALDVLEHVEDIDKYLDKFIQLSSNNGKLIVSGPTENWLYKIGRKAARFSDHSHKRNIDFIEDKIRSKGLELCKRKCLYFPFTLFKISMWSFNNFKD